ncbi:MAG: NUDIX hydrolase [Anaerobacillus sp.]|uniref:NUDIX hydrolase n=1 Tax=Anaerobacillus sp. TaxID=1872506 RepID=UPI00391DE862
MKDEFYEKTISTKPIFSGRVIDLVVKDVELPDGKTSKREIINHPGAVAVIALTKENKILLVKQFRKPLEKTIVEIPAGKLEIGEDPLECAKRELEEETGYKALNIKFITSFYTSPGFADELIHIYFTDQIEIGEINCDEDEFLSVMEISLQEAEKLIEQQIIHDAKTVYAIQFLKLKGGLT